ncbi:BatD family protein [Vibrio sp.]|nr:BatD family protein [Vibrio sp.]
MRTVLNTLILALALLTSWTGYARTTATVSQNQVTQNEVFQLTISTDQDVDRDAVDFKQLKSQFMVSQPSFGHSISIINGSRSNKSEWRVTLATNQLGVVTIPSFQIKGEKTQPVAIQVVKDVSSPKTKDLVQIQTHIDKSTLYPNESTLMHVKLIIKADTRAMQDPKITPPSADGVSLEAASEPDQSQQVINGISATVLTQSFRITATNPGKHSVKEPQFQSSMYYRDVRGNTKILPLVTQPKTFTINVMAKPQQYQGTWLPTSSLSLTDDWLGANNKPISDNPIKLDVGDSLTRIIHLEVNGVGQDRIPDIALNYPKSLRVYPEKPSYKTLPNGNMEMTLKQVIIASAPGQYTLPGVTLNWWDTTAQKQRKSFLQAKDIVVTGSPVTQPQKPELTKEAPVQESAAPKIITKTVTDSGYWPYLTGLFAILWLLTLLLFILKLKKQATTKESTLEEKNKGDSQQTTFDALKAAINDKDGINIQRLYTLWKSEQGYVGDDANELDNAIADLLAQLYSRDSSAYQPDNVLSLLKRFAKMKKHNREKKSFKLPKM